MNNIKIKKLSTERMEPYLYGLLAFSLVLGIWYALSAFTTLAKVLPSPFKVISSFIYYLYSPLGKYTLLEHAVASFGRVMVGFSIASICGIIFGILMGWSKVGNAIINPFYSTFRTIPPLAWIPLGILWFGVNEEVKYFIIFIGAFLIIMTNARDGARKVDKDLFGVALMLGASKKQLMWKIVLPASVPYIFAGLQVGLSTAWATMVAAEMIRSSNGLGWIIIVGMESANITQIFVGVLALGLFGFVIVTIMRKVEKLLCAWNERGK